MVYSHQVSVEGDECVEPASVTTNCSLMNILIAVHPTVHQEVNFEFLLARFCCNVLQHLLQYSAASVAVFCIIYCSVLHHLLQCSGASVAVFCSICCSVLKHLVQWSAASVAVFCSICCSVLQHLLQCSQASVAVVCSICCSVL